MAIRSREMQTASAGRTMTSSFWYIPAMNTRATYFLNAATLQNVAVNGTVTGFTSQYGQNVQSLFFTAVFGGGAGLTAVALNIFGENQFGESVTEVVTLTTLGTTVQSQNCYRRITGLTVNRYTGTQTPGAGDTISMGYSLVAPSLPLLAKLDSTGSVLAVFDLYQATKASQPAYTIIGAPNWIIDFSGTLQTSTAGSGEVCVILNPDDSAL